MGTQYFCKSRRRRLEVRRPEHAPLNGIDYLEVLDRDAIGLSSPRQRTLLVRCIRDLDGSVSGDNVAIRGGVRVTPIVVEWAGRAADAMALHADGKINDDERDYFLAREDAVGLLIVRTASYGDYSTYRLCLIEDDAPLGGFDPPLTEVDFSFKVECPSEFDCRPETECPPEALAVPPIDYLAKDYESFRKLMLDRLSVLMPDWADREPADLGVALVEVLAYAADRLSYYQDAVGAESYLGTARRRPSMRRHARLLDYAMHEGCNARAWLFLEMDDGVRNASLRFEEAGRPTQFLTRVPGYGAEVTAAELQEILGSRSPRVFEPLFENRLFAAHNRIPFYTWGDEECCLPKGATRATLRDDDDNRLCLSPGDVLVFEEVKGTATGQAADADPARRHAVRLTRVKPAAEIDEDGVRMPVASAERDELFDVPYVEIEWDAADALPFPLCLSKVMEQGGEDVLVQDISVARGNIVLADHGWRLPSEELDPPTGDRTYRPGLDEPDVTYGVPFEAERWGGIVDPARVQWMSAGAAIAQDPRKALPKVTLRDTDGRDWAPVRDLLASDRFDTDFVVEMDNARRAVLRFGDGIYGEIPERTDPDQGEMPPRATYRIGNGVAGNVGAETISHVVTPTTLGIKMARNPMPATGGSEPESMEEVRQYAPQAFRRQERAVTEADYAEVAERHDEVSKAVARRLYTGSWHTMFVTVDRVGARRVDREFENELRAWIDRFRLAGHDVEIEPPQFVPLDIALRVCVGEGYIRSEVKRTLLDVFSSHDLPDGRRGYFHPDNLTFGQPVYLSHVIAKAMEIDGVRWVSVDEAASPPARFQRWGEKPRGEIAQGFIGISRLEIAQLDNDPNAQENGKIEFFMEGGL